MDVILSISRYWRDKSVLMLLWAYKGFKGQVFHNVGFLISVLIYLFRSGGKGGTTVTISPCMLIIYPLYSAHLYSSRVKVFDVSSCEGKAEWQSF